VQDPYPYTVVPVRGRASDAESVVVHVNGAGDPLAGPVNLFDLSYCVEVPLPEPADYDITVVSIASGQSASQTSLTPGHLKFTYDPGAPDQTITGCNGENLHR
jgi:hypothetical protein